MATKRSASTATSTSQDSAKKAKWQVSVLTYKKWQTNYEKEYQTLHWISSRLIRLQTSTPRDLLKIHTEGLPLASFSAENAVELWWKDCSSTRRVNQGPRKAYCPQEKASSDMTASPGPDVSTSSDPGTSSSSSDTLALQKWDSWFHPSDSEIEDSDWLFWWYCLYVLPISSVNNSKWEY